MHVVCTAYLWLIEHVRGGDNMKTWHFGLLVCAFAVGMGIALNYLDGGF